MWIIRKRFMDEKETDHSYNWQDVFVAERLIYGTGRIKPKRQ